MVTQGTCVGVADAQSDVKRLTMSSCLTFLLCLIQNINISFGYYSLYVVFDAPNLKYYFCACFQPYRLVNIKFAVLLLYKEVAISVITVTSLHLTSLGFVSASL